MNFISPSDRLKIYDRTEEPGYIPDPWQQAVELYQGSLVIRSGRQVGKSKTVSRKVARAAVQHDKIVILMLAPAQRQSSQLFEKVLFRLNLLHQQFLDDAGGFKEDPSESLRQSIERRRYFERENGIFLELPTKTEIKLKWGTRIYSLPAGKTGIYIRSYTVDILVIDEAAFVPEPVYKSIIPMLSVSEKEKGMGWEWLLSTPFGKGGYFYTAFTNSRFAQWHVSCEDCPRISKKFLLEKKKALSSVEYAQEYLGEFIDEFNQLWKSDLLKSRMSFITYNFEKEHHNAKFSYYLGVDIARYGQDETAFVIAELHESGYIRIVYSEVRERQSITQTAGFAKFLDTKWRFKKIFLDDAGVGGGVLDLMQESVSKFRVIGLNNAKKSVNDERQEESRKRILKEDLYSNATVLMETEPVRIAIISDLRLLRSLKSMTYEYTKEGNLRIFGPYSHLAEAFVRALWCAKLKGLRLFLA